MLDHPLAGEVWSAFHLKMGVPSGDPHLNTSNYDRA